MSVTWGNLKTTIRLAVLKDASSTRWSDAQLLDGLTWALDTFAIHTANPSSVQWTVLPARAVTYTMPDNVFDDPMKTALIRYKSTSLDCYEFLSPLRLTEGAIWSPVLEDDNTTPRGWWVWPDSTLNLRFKPESGSTLDMFYFSSYTAPVDDADVIEIPRWAEGPVAVLTGAFAQVAPGVAASNIRQWGTKPDTGTPESNPLHKETKNLYDLYLRMVQQHPAQERESYWEKVRSRR